MDAVDFSLRQTLADCCMMGIHIAQVLVKLLALVNKSPDVFNKLEHLRRMLKIVVTINFSQINALLERVNYKQTLARIERPYYDRCIFCHQDFAHLTQGVESGFVALPIHHIHQQGGTAILTI